MWKLGGNLLLRSHLARGVSALSRPCTRLPLKVKRNVGQRYFFSGVFLKPPRLVNAVGMFASAGVFAGLGLLSYKSKFGVAFAEESPPGLVVLGSSNVEKVVPDSDGGEQESTTAKDSAAKDSDGEPESPTALTVLDERSGSIWIWVVNAAKQDWWLYLVAAAASLGMAVCGVMEARQFGDIYGMFSSGDGNIWVPVRKLLVLFGTEFGLSFLATSFLALATNRLGQRLRESYFESIVRQDMEFFDETKQGEIMQHISEDIGAICTAVRQMFTTGFRSGMNLIAGTVNLFILSPTIGTFIVGTLPVLAISAHFLAMGLQGLSKRVSKANGAANAVANETVSNVRTVKAFTGELREKVRYSSALEGVVGLKMKMALGAGSYYAALHFGINSMQLLLCVFGGKLISEGKLDSGGMVTVTSQVLQLQRAYAGISRTMTGMVKAMATCDGVYEVVQRCPKLENERGLRTLEKAGLKGEVVFSGVDFRYPSRPRVQVLRNLNLTLPPGKVVALVGASGCGKSTIGSLIERFYDPESGSVLVDGVALTQYEAKSVRSMIGMVDQSPALFACSVLENLKYGRPDATEAEVIEAAKAANAHNFISAFPDGYNTELGEHGSQLSGGQRQRIAIARALLKDPRILLLDEATSALDAASEQVVQDALSRLMKGRTVLVIAHRLSTVIDADMICVMHRGHIVEKGTHMELMRLGGRYAALFRKQQAAATVSGAGVDS